MKQGDEVWYLSAGGDWKKCTYTGVRTTSAEPIIRLVKSRMQIKCPERLLYQLFDN